MDTGIQSYRPDVTSGDAGAGSWTERQVLSVVLQHSAGNRFAYILCNHCYVAEHDGSAGRLMPPPYYLPHALTLRSRVPLLGQVKYPVKPRQPITEHSPDSVLATYGFMPADVAMRSPSPAAPAFWPEVALSSSRPHADSMGYSDEQTLNMYLCSLVHFPSSWGSQAWGLWSRGQTTTFGKGPHISATAAAARKPPARVLFRAAARVDAPERPGAALRWRQLAALTRRPAKPADDNFSIEVGTCCTYTASGRRKIGAFHAPGEPMGAPRLDLAFCMACFLLCMQLPRTPDHASSTRSCAISTHAT